MIKYGIGPIEYIKEQENMRAEELDVLYVM